MPSPSDKALLSLISQDLPASLTPYRDWAQKLGITEEALLTRIKIWLEEGKLRRWGATLNHRQVGYRANALTVWVVPEEQVEAFAYLAATRPEISHCYLRIPRQDWPYNLYTVIHGTSRENCQKIARELAAMTGINQYQLLFSLHEFKKTRLQF